VFVYSGVGGISIWAVEWSQMKGPGPDMTVATSLICISDVVVHLQLSVWWLHIGET